MSPDRRERGPAVPRDIEGIDPETDTRVRILGTVLEVRQDSLMLDDGTATTEVFVNADDLDGLTQGQRVRVFGRVLPTPDAFEIQGELVQDMAALDMDRYEEAKDVLPRERLP